MKPNEHRIRLAISFLNDFKARKEELIGPPVTFDMNTFGEAIYDDDDRDFDDYGYNVCGTAACAAGSLGLLPQFRRMGLKLDLKAQELFVYGSNGDTYENLARFFKVDEEVSLSWFSPDSYPNFKITPKMVAARMVSYLKNPERYMKRMKYEQPFRFVWNT